MKRKKATSDGISRADWEEVVELAAEIANAACSDNQEMVQTLTRNLSKLLGVLETKYGELPSILEARATCTDDLPERVRLLERAWQVAGQRSDIANLVFISSSLAQLYVEELKEMTMGHLWLNHLEKCLGNHWDEEEHQELQRLRRLSEYEKLGSHGT
jgi:hypothetical protein